MVSAQGQFPGDVFAVRGGVEGEFEVACLTDEKTAGGQDGAVGIGDCEAKFAGSILRASQRGGEQEQECSVNQDGVDRNTAQIDSPRSGGTPRRYFTAMTSGGCWTGALLLSGGRGRAAFMSSLLK
jgi:hypothetical protein